MRTLMTSPVSMATQNVGFLFILSLLPLLNSSITYKQLLDNSESQSFLPWHRIPECPNDSDNFIRDSSCKQTYGSDGVLRYSCTDFTQYCFNKTMSITCTNYTRECTGYTDSCKETYEGCKVANHTTEETFITKAIGVPQTFYAECIPALDALRDQCVVSKLQSCKTSYTVDPIHDYLLSCTIDCAEYHMQCYNYTRTCTSESSRVVNTTTDKSVKIDKSRTSCSVTTLERRLDEHAVWNGTIIRTEQDAEGNEKQIPRGSVIIDRFLFYEWDETSSWESCSEAAYVPYQPMCNQFIRHIMEPLNEVIFEPHAFDLNEGAKQFLSKWDGGWDILCEYRCFRQLVKFSRNCWPRIPLQRFLPGADYQTLENVLKNMTRIACFTVPPPVVKSIDEPWLNSRNSCAVFFDSDHNITRPFYQQVEDNCAEGEADTICTQQCTMALDAIAKRFGCCLGSIRSEYNYSSVWYAHFNFRDNPVLRRINKCNTTLITACETIFVTSLVVTIIRNMIYVGGGLMCLVIVVMTVSFYWQLEHEPIKKRFYHF